MKISKKLKYKFLFYNDPRASQTLKIFLLELYFAKFAAWDKDFYYKRILIGKYCFLIDIF